MAKKYKNIEKNMMGVGSLNRNQMLHEIQSLAGALIKAEKRATKQKKEQRERERKLK